MKHLSTARLKAMELTDAEREACHASIRTGSKSFYAASMLLPRDTRFAARALYAFCRHSDDLVDEDSSGRVACAELENRLEKIYSGTPSELLADRAFAYVVERYQIPKAVPSALIEGFRWDEAGRNYETLEDVLDYSARVASTVGVMMTLIMGSRDRHVLARAAELGLAMQLTNIARDVGEDARNGRLYLPQAWVRDAGMSPEQFLRNPIHSQQLATVISRLLGSADELYRGSMTGISGLPMNCQTAIRAAASIYREIGREIARNDHDSVSARAFTGRGKKLALMGTAALPRLVEPPVARTAPSPSIAFLVEAAADPASRSDENAVSRFIDLLAAAQKRHVARTARARRGLSRA
jgi:15-cis-phytoene synthase